MTLATPPESLIESVIGSREQKGVASGACHGHGKEGPLVASNAVSKAHLLAKSHLFRSGDHVVQARGARERGGDDGGPRRTVTHAFHMATARGMWRGGEGVGLFIRAVVAASGDGGFPSHRTARVAR